MELKFSLTEEDIYALALYRLKVVPGLKRQVLVTRWGYSIIMVVLAAMFLLYEQYVIGGICFLLGLLIFLYFPAYQKWRIRRRITHNYQGEKEKASLAEWTIRIEKDGLALDAPASNSKTKWEYITYCDIQANHTFISVSDIPSFSIPRLRVSAGEYETFVEALKKCVPKKRAK